MLSMTERDFAMVAYGDIANSVFTDRKQDGIIDDFLDDFAYDDWAGGIADYIRTNNTAQVKQIIHGMKKEHHLSEDEIQPYLDRLDNFDKNKGIEKDYNFIAVITNAEDYLKGDFESVKIYLPSLTKISV